MGKYKDQLPKCEICVGFHKTEDHRCRVTSYNKGVSKVCNHIIMQCTNYRNGHYTNSNQCILKHKREKKV